MSLRDIYEKYHKDVQFISIYIREAHPVDGWWLGKGAFGVIIKLSRSKVALNTYDPTTIEQRRIVAGECEDALKYGIHTYVDAMDDAVNQAYAAWPTRLYLVGLNGKVVYGGGLGPFDFKPSVFDKEIGKYLAEILVSA